MTSVYALLADIILVVHFLFILFVGGGQGLILIGGARDWQWVKNFIFRILHLSAIGIVVAQAWAGVWCPLTLWENSLRRLAGQDTYTESFIQHWIGRLIFYDAPAWVFILFYSVFGGIVCLSWILVRPVRGGKGSGRDAYTPYKEER